VLIMPVRFHPFGFDCLASAADTADLRAIDPG
jgi:hypothetical protein